MMTYFVKNGIPDLLPDFGLAPADSFDVAFVKVDDVRHLNSQDRPLSQWNSLVKTKQKVTRRSPKPPLDLWRGKILDHDLDVIQVLSELIRELVQRLRDQLAKARH
jgi:hypothetical protein